MPTTYQIADDDVYALLADVMEEHHPRLHAAGVKVGVLFALNPDGDAVKHHGAAAFACVKPVSLKDRVSKRYDAELLIDEEKWNDAPAVTRAALVDHELSHLRVVPKSDKELRASGADGVTWKTDDLGRPVVKTIAGDWDAGDGFAAVVERHGDAAVEYLNINLAKARADAARERGVPA